MEPRPDDRLVAGGRVLGGGHRGRVASGAARPSVQARPRVLQARVVEHRAPDVGIPEKRYAGETGNDFPQQLQSLPTEFRGDSAEPGDISAGACEARHEPGSDRIGTDRHHDRDRPGLPFDRGNHLIRARHDDVHLEAHQLPCDPRKSFGFALAVSKL